MTTKTTTTKTITSTPTAAPTITGNKMTSSLASLLTSPLRQRRSSISHISMTSSEGSSFLRRNSISSKNKKDMIKTDNRKSVKRDNTAAIDTATNSTTITIPSESAELKTTNNIGEETGRQKEETVPPKATEDLPSMNSSCNSSSDDCSLYSAIDLMDDDNAADNYNDDDDDDDDTNHSKGDDQQGYVSSVSAPSLMLSNVNQNKTVEGIGIGNSISGSPRKQKSVMVRTFRKIVYSKNHQFRLACEEDDIKTVESLSTERTSKQRRLSKSASVRLSKSSAGATTTTTTTSSKLLSMKGTSNSNSNSSSRNIMNTMSSNNSIDDATINNTSNDNNNKNNNNVTACTTGTTKSKEREIRLKKSKTTYGSQFDLSLDDNVTIITKINIECKDDDGNTPLHLAAGKGHYDTCILLIQKGHTINCVNRIGRTPIHLACRFNHINVVQLLIHNGADISIKTKRNGETPLHCASHNGHLHIVKLLLDHMLSSRKLRINSMKEHTNRITTPNTAILSPSNGSVSSSTNNDYNTNTNCYKTTTDNDDDDDDANDANDDLSFSESESLFTKLRDHDFIDEEDCYNINDNDETETEHSYSRQTKQYCEILSSGEEKYSKPIVSSISSSSRSSSRRKETKAATTTKKGSTNKIMETSLHRKIRNNCIVEEDESDHITDTGDNDNEDDDDKEDDNNNNNTNKMAEVKKNKSDDNRTTMTASIQKKDKIENTAVITGSNNHQQSKKQNCITSTDERLKFVPNKNNNQQLSKSNHSTRSHQYRSSKVKSSIRHSDNHTSNSIESLELQQQQQRNRKMLSSSSLFADEKKQSALSLSPPMELFLDLRCKYNKSNSCSNILSSSSYKHNQQLSTRRTTHKENSFGGCTTGTNSTRSNDSRTIDTVSDLNSNTSIDGIITATTTTTTVGTNNTKGSVPTTTDRTIPVTTTITKPKKKDTTSSTSSDDERPIARAKMNTPAVVGNNNTSTGSTSSSAAALRAKMINNIKTLNATKLKTTAIATTNNSCNANNTDRNTAKSSSVVNSKQVEVTKSDTKTKSTEKSSHTMNATSAGVALPRIGKSVKGQSSQRTELEASSAYDSYISKFLHESITQDIDCTAVATALPPTRDDMKNNNCNDDSEGSMSESLLPINSEDVVKETEKRPIVARPRMTDVMAMKQSIEGKEQKYDDTEDHVPVQNFMGMSFRNLLSKGMAGLSTSVHMNNPNSGFGKDTSVKGNTGLPRSSSLEMMINKPKSQFYAGMGKSNLNKSFTNLNLGAILHKNDNNTSDIKSVMNNSNSGGGSGGGEQDGAPNIFTSSIRNLGGLVGVSTSNNTRKDIDFLARTSGHEKSKKSYEAHLMNFVDQNGHDKQLTVDKPPNEIGFIKYTDVDDYEHNKKTNLSLSSSTHSAITRNTAKPAGRDFISKEERRNKEAYRSSTEKEDIEPTYQKSEAEPDDDDDDDCNGGRRQSYTRRRNFTNRPCQAVQPRRQQHGTVAPSSRDGDTTESLQQTSIRNQTKSRAATKKKRVSRDRQYNGNDSHGDFNSSSEEFDFSSGKGGGIGKGSSDEDNRSMHRSFTKGNSSKGKIQQKRDDALEQFQQKSHHERQAQSKRVNKARQQDLQQGQRQQQQQQQQQQQDQQQIEHNRTQQQYNALSQSVRSIFSANTSADTSASSVSSFFDEPDEKTNEQDTFL